MERFDIYIHGFRTDLEEPAPTALARVFRIEQSLARDFVRSLPRIVKRRVSTDELERYAEALGDIGAIYELRPSPIEPARIIAIDGQGEPLDEKPTGRTLTLPPPVSSHPPPAADQPRTVMQSTLLGALPVIGISDTLVAAPRANEQNAVQEVATTEPAASAEAQKSIWSDTTPVTPMRFDTDASAATLAVQAAPDGVKGFALVAGHGAPRAERTVVGAGFDSDDATLREPAPPVQAAARPDNDLQVGDLIRPPAAAARPVTALHDDQRAGWVTDDKVFRRQVQQTSELAGVGELAGADEASVHPAARGGVGAATLAVETAAHPESTASAAIASALPIAAPVSQPPVLGGAAALRPPQKRFLPGDPMAPPELLAAVRASSRPPPGSRATRSIESREPESGVVANVLRAIGVLGLVAFLLFTLRTMSTCDAGTLLAAGDGRNDRDHGSRGGRGGAKTGRGKYGPIADEWLDDAMHEVVSGDKELVRARVYELKAAGAVEVYVASITRSGPVRLAKQLVIELPSEEPARTTVIEIYTGYLDSHPDPKTLEGPVLRLEL